MLDTIEQIVYSTSSHSLSLSYGKDSLACLGAIEQLGWPLERIIHAEVWATDDIPADLPPMVEFKSIADTIIMKRYGIEVEHVSATVTYRDIFYKQRKSGKHTGEIHGFPMARGAWCQDRLKGNILDSTKKLTYEDIFYQTFDSGKNKGRIYGFPFLRGPWCNSWLKRNVLLRAERERERESCFVCWHSSRRNKKTEIS